MQTILTELAEARALNGAVGAVDVPQGTDLANYIASFGRIMGAFT
jgi:hypothetical protein